MMTNVQNVIKYSAVRIRPAASLNRELCKVKRALPVLCIQFATGQTVTESFFSGDAAGSALIATTQHMLLGHSSWWMALPIFTALGRMYIHAHHALDVTVGVLFGTASALGFNAIVPVRSNNYYHFFSSVVGFVVWQLILRKMKPALPAAYARDWLPPKGAHDS